MEQESIRPFTYLLYNCSGIRPIYSTLFLEETVADLEIRSSHNTANSCHVQIGSKERLNSFGNSKRLSILKYKLSSEVL